MAMKMHLSFFLFATIGSIEFVSVTSTTTHIVGDSLGWNLPTHPNFFADWVKNRTFAVGDVLLFQYNPGLNTVVQVNKHDYQHCTSTNTINMYVKGNSQFILEKPGDYYFYSNVGKHCELGQKLWVHVPRGHQSSR